MRFSLAALASVGALAASVAAIDTITVKDRHFVYSSTGKPFWAAGVDYQPGGSSAFKAGSDPLSDVEACARDAYLFQKLGINVVRVYSVDPTLDHSQCMSLLASAGIYLILDVNSPLQGQYINNHEPWTTYTPEYLTHIFSVMEAFACYDNTLGFFAGNEVVLDTTTSTKVAPSYIKAVARDMKAYASKNLHRKFPIGYSNADVLSFRTSLPTYLECGDESETIDFLGVNSYAWCGQSTFQEAGYDKLVAAYQNSSIPIIFSEYGCNQVTPRVFQETGVLYSEQMTGVFSGGLVYEYAMESNAYGLVEVNTDGSVKTFSDYTAYQGQLAKVDLSKVTIPANAPASSRLSTCPPATDPVYSGITANLTLPATLGADLIKNGIAKKPTCKGFLSSGSFKTSSKYSINCNGKDITDKAVKGTMSLSGSSSSSSNSSSSPVSSSAAASKPSSAAASSAPASSAAAPSAPASSAAAPSVQVSSAVASSAAAPSAPVSSAAASSAAGGAAAPSASTAVAGSAGTSTAVAAASQTTTAAGGATAGTVTGVAAGTVVGGAASGTAAGAIPAASGTAAGTVVGTAAGAAPAASGTATAGPVVGTGAGAAPAAPSSTCTEEGSEASTTPTQLLATSSIAPPADIPAVSIATGSNAATSSGAAAAPPAPVATTPAVVPGTTLLASVTTASAGTTLPGGVIPPLATGTGVASSYGNSSNTTLTYGGPQQVVMGGGAASIHGGASVAALAALAAAVLLL